MNERLICLVSVDVRSAHNIGAFFRTCDGFGVELYIVGASPRPKSSGDQRLPHIIRKAETAIHKTALGAENNVRWRYAESLREAIDELHAEGYQVYGLEQSSISQPIMNVHHTGNIALVVGREVEGLTEDEIALCDGCFEIPMKGKKESFNVSVAAAIGLYESIR
jgi:23S rRNA (guanosine2251-2'-O)-methyltransferase